MHIEADLFRKGKESTGFTGIEAMRNILVFYPLLAISLVLLFCVSLVYGSVSIPFNSVLDILWRERHWL